MKVRCVILNYKTPEMTIRATRSAQKALAEISHHIDVVDNDSQDGSLEKMSDALACEENVSVLDSGHNGGYGAGNNFAIRRAFESAEIETPEYFYILNSDAFPQPDAVTALVDFLERTPAAGLAGSSIHGDDGEPHVTAFRFPSLQSEVVGSVRLGALKKVFPESEIPILPKPETTQRVDWTAGASLLIRREVFETIGYFDETFFLYFEETDLCRRAIQAGFETWYITESRVAHIGGASTGMKETEKPMPRYWFESRRHYFVKNHGRAYTWAANLSHAVGLASFRLRAAIQDKDNPDRKHFLRDFLRFNFLDKRP